MNEDITRSKDRSAVLLILRDLHPSLTCLGKEYLRMRRKANKAKVRPETLSFRAVFLSERPSFSLNSTPLL